MRGARAESKECVRSKRRGSERSESEGSKNCVQREQEPCDRYLLLLTPDNMVSITNAIL